jgi:hypothetical protein
MSECAFCGLGAWSSCARCGKPTCRGHGGGSEHHACRTAGDRIADALERTATPAILPPSQNITDRAAYYPAEPYGRRGMSECPIHRVELLLGRCWMCRGVPPGAASRSEQSAARVCQCCGRGPDECPLVAGASATCAGGDCACFPPAAEAAQSTQVGAEMDEDGCCVVCGRGLEPCYACGPSTESSESAALAALNAQWKEALLQYEGCAFWIAAEQHSCSKCAPLRALLSEGK